MKLFYDLSKLDKSTTFKYDAQLIKGVQIGLAVFLIISSLTVFSGIKSHLSEYLVSVGIFYKLFLLSISYIIGSLGVDLVNTTCFAYVVSALLRKDYTREAKILIAFCCLLSSGLTYYSYQMSQNSAVVIADNIEQENQVNDTDRLTNIDTTLNNNLAVIEARYVDDYSRITDQYKKQIENISSSFDNQIAVLQNEIEVIDKNSNESNYLYAAKQKKPITNKIQSLEADKLDALTPILSKQQNDIDTLTARKEVLRNLAISTSKFDRTRTTAATDEKNNKTKATSNVFASLFSKLSGYAVFALLLLAAIKQVLFFRNDITPTPILSNFDFSPSWLIEVASFPFVWMQRHAVNKVRSAYAMLPEISEPNAEKTVFDGNSIEQVIKQVTANFDDDDGQTIAVTMPVYSNLDTAPNTGLNAPVITAPLSSAKNTRKIGDLVQCKLDTCKTGLFALRAVNQLFCCKEHKQEWHKLKHGKAFDPKKYKHPKK